MATKYNDYASIGLEPRDMHVYETLYTNEDSSLRTLASLTGLNRGTVYEVVKKLMDMGLVTFYQTGQRRRYTAANPQVLMALINDQRERLKHLESTASNYVRLLETTRHEQSNFMANFYEGDEGIAAILRDVLQTLQDKGIREYSVISSRLVSNFLYANFKGFSRKRIEQGIFVRVLADTLPTDETALAERRQLPVSAEHLNGYLIIYGDKTALISLTETNQLSGIIIHDKGIRNMQQLIFEQLWLVAVSAPNANKTS
jgi:sugar-specific transcriptional regulator TrmB